MCVLILPDNGTTTWLFGYVLQVQFGCNPVGVWRPLGIAKPAMQGLFVILNIVHQVEIAHFIVLPWPAARTNIQCYYTTPHTPTYTTPLPHLPIVRNVIAFAIHRATRR